MDDCRGVRTCCPRQSRKPDAVAVLVWANLAGAQVLCDQRSEHAPTTCSSGSRARVRTWRLRHDVHCGRAVADPRKQLPMPRFGLPLLLTLTLPRRQLRAPMGAARAPAPPPTPRRPSFPRLAHRSSRSPLLLPTKSPRSADRPPQYVPGSYQGQGGTSREPLERVHPAEQRRVSSLTAPPADVLSVVLRRVTRCS